MPTNLLSNIATISPKLNFFLLNPQHVSAIKKIGYFRTELRAYFSVSTNAPTEFSSKIQHQTIKTIGKLISCEDKDVLNIYKAEPLLKAKDETSIKQRIDYLVKNKVSKSAILEHPFLLVNRG